jgi:hypothetical protein
MMSRSNLIAGLAVAMVLVAARANMTLAQVPDQPAVPGGPQTAARHITIPFLANATRPADLSFEGGECEIDRTGNTMTCEFQQVFFTTSDLAPQTCLVTTSRYARTFTKQAPLNGTGPGGNTRWVSSQAPEGLCGISETTTLQDDGTVKWTMETRKRVTRNDADPACRAVDERPETLSWQNLRRALPCAFIQPGGITP